MKAQGSGYIVNISSAAGRIARAGFGVYAATKWGVGAFSEVLRQEVAQQNIRVTVIELALVATEIQEQITDPAAKEQIQAQMHAVTPLASEDIATAIVYAVTVPQHVSINEILIRPTKEL